VGNKQRDQVLCVHADGQAYIHRDSPRVASPR
jgi:hypothetical protein